MIRICGHTKKVSDSLITICDLRAGHAGPHHMVPAIETLCMDVPKGAITFVS